VITKAQSHYLVKHRNSIHRACFVCSKFNKRGLQLDFYFDRYSKCAVTEFQLEDWSQGYNGIPHGGIISAIFDGVMGNCLFAQDLTGVTAEMKIRFKHIVELGRKATAKAWIKNCSDPLYILEAEIIQNEQVKAYAMGKFVNKPDLADKQNT
jgi:acyl-coenzyme A thioesterase PaaI-like protein